MAAKLIADAGPCMLPMYVAGSSMHVLIADDFPSARSRMKELLADAYPCANFSEAANGDEVMSQLAGSVFTLVLLDLNMPGRSGVEMLHDVRQNYPELPVFIVSFHPRESYAKRCLQAGATAYINKDDADEELVPAIRTLWEDCPA